MSLNSQMILSRSNIEASQVGQTLTLRPNMNSKRKAGLAGLTLTSLVDCFTILVAYLLAVTHIGAVEFPVDKNIKLPQASYSLAAKDSAVITLTQGQYLVGKDIVKSKNLASTLEDLKTTKKSESLLIQADEKTAYEDLNPIVMAGLQAGFKKIGFAILQKEANE